MANADKAGYDNAISHIYSGRATGLVTRVRPGTRNLAPKFARPADRRPPRPPRPRSAWRQAIIAALALVLVVTLGVFGADEFLIHRDTAAVAAASAR
jgi:hypothetical protein